MLRLKNCFSKKQKGQDTTKETFMNVYIIHKLSINFEIITIE